MNLYESVRNNLKESPVLSPEYSSRKSFYDKAKYTDDENGRTLRSYQTDIMRIKDGKIEMLCDENALTNTTLRHIKEFLLQNGMEPLTKQQLIKLINEKNVTESDEEDDYEEDDYEGEEDDYESIYDIADSWDGNGANDELDDSEWKEIFENAPDTYLQALSRRAAFVKDWWGEIPDLVWNELEDNVKQKLGFINYDPMTVIDNVIVNGDYGDFDNYKQEDETDEDFVARVEDEVYRIFPEERFVIYSL